MILLAKLMRWEIAVLLLAYAGTVFAKLLNGGINTTGLLYGRISAKGGVSTHYFSPERVQLLTITVIAALNYLFDALANSHRGTLPDIPQSWPAVVGGSNVLYLGGKAFARWFGNKGTGDNKNDDTPDDGHGASMA